MEFKRAGAVNERYVKTHSHVAGGKKREEKCIANPSIIALLSSILEAIIVSLIDSLESLLWTPMNLYCEILG